MSKCVTVKYSDVMYAMKKRNAIQLIKEVDIDPYCDLNHNSNTKSGGLFTVEVCIKFQGKHLLDLMHKFAVYSSINTL